MMTEREYRDLQRRADDICLLILSSDLPEVDIAIERNKLRSEIEDNFPDQLRLYDRIYESRFDRLWEQWRANEE
jgi:hypothetical protein